MTLKFKMQYYDGHPAGWADDLGIIADKNQWVEEEYAGWYCYPTTLKWGMLDEKDSIYQWCRDNIRNYWNNRNFSFYFTEEKDAMLFMLRWSGP